MEYPTRNHARALLSSIFSSMKTTHINYTEVCIPLIVWHKNESTNAFNSLGLVFQFTNALADIVPIVNVENEDLIHLNVMVTKTPTKEIETMFKHYNIDLNVILNIYTSDELKYKIEITHEGADNYNLIWFNNAEMFVPSFLHSYQNFKKNKGMLFLDEDIIQVTIDYSIAICYNHYSQNKYLNIEIIKNIIKTLTKATNLQLNKLLVNEQDVFNILIEDIKNPKKIKCAYDFINSLV